MIRLVVLGGSGDAYLVCALAQAFAQHHGRDVEVVLGSRLAPVADMFDVRYRTDDDLVRHAEADYGFQADYDNDRLAEDRPFYAHPCFLRSRLRVDWLTTKPDATQADMYRIILGLPPTAPLALPTPPTAARRPNTITMLTESTSWPNTQPSFWSVLAGALVVSGWDVEVNDPAWSLKGLLEHCASSEWVIGPQCGVMSVLVTGRFPCRKTLATPNIDGNRRPEYLAPETFPYGYVTKFAGSDHDVEEFKISDDNHSELIETIVNGANAQSLWPHDPAPVVSVQTPLSPGDFLDRLAVLEVKHRRFALLQRAAIEREYQRYLEIKRQLPLSEHVEKLYECLVDLHNVTFIHLDELMKSFEKATGKEHAVAIQLNLARGKLKREIDLVCHAPYTEIKDYSGVNQ